MQLKVDSRVIVQLGSELVSDEKQAILELVKNAYDADSPNCIIKITTDEITTLVHTGDPSLLKFNKETPTINLHFDSKKVDHFETATRTITATGKISIIDKGDGVPLSALQNSWLVISNSLKRVSGDGPKKTTHKGRTPLGDKGVGRLATMKLGDVLLIESSTSEDAPINQVFFRWADCLPGITLDSVPVCHHSIENTERFKGTKVHILGLDQPTYWKSPTRSKELASDLSKLISPFEGAKTFPVKININGAEHELASITEDALTKALARISIRWDSEKQELSLTAKLKKKIFKGNDKKSNHLYDRYLGDNEDQQLLDYLLQSNKIKPFQPKFSTEKDWFIVASSTYKSDQIATPSTYSPFEDPGSFDAEINFFHIQKIHDDLDSSHLDKEAKFDLQQLKSIETESIKNAIGVAVLRDGFRIPLDGDWLGISLEATSGSSYGLRLGNVVGYFSLTGQNNYKLIEKSDREAFVQNDAYRGFMRLAKRSTKYANDFLEATRRRAKEYLEEKDNFNKAGSKAKLPQNFEDALSALPRTVDSVRITRDQIKSISARVNSQTENALSIVTKHGNDLATDPKSNEIVTSIYAKLEASSKDIASLLKEVEMLLSNIQSDHLSIISIEKKFKLLDEQISALYESAAVGLSARSLVHDIATYTSEISASASLIKEDIDKNIPDKKAALSQVTSIKRSVRELHNVVTLIDPMLPAQREIKETFSLKEFIDDYFSKRARTFNDDKIGVVVIPTFNPTVKVTRGRLLQIVDNLARNSQYWLNQSLSQEKVITLEILSDGFIFSDNGPGVSEEVEESLFDLFVSEKPASEKGGIGLFIVQQLLQIIGGSAILLPEKNMQNRRYKFYVELSTIII